MSDEQKISGEGRLRVGPFGWIVRWEASDTWLDFKAYEIIGEGVDNKKEYFRGPSEDSMSDWVTEPTYPTYSGYVKWDGCMEIDLGSKHFCGADGVAELGDLLKALHRLALKIPRVDRDCAGYGAND